MMEYILDKLGHPSAEVRGRALESLEFKWKYGLLGADDLLQEPRVLKGLLGLLGLGDGPQTTAVALLLLRRMAAADGRLAAVLLELGALQHLHTQLLQQAPAAGAGGDPADEAEPQLLWVEPGVWPHELVPSVEALARLLLAGPEVRGSSSTAGRKQLLGDLPPSAHASPPPSVGLTVSPTDDDVAAGGGASRSPTQPGVGAMLPRRHQHQQYQHWRHGSMDSLASTSAAGAYGYAGAPGADAPAITAAGAPHDTAAVFDDRVLRARARADWRQQAAAAPGPAPASTAQAEPACDALLAAQQQPLPGRVTLPALGLSAADDQALFEANVRLQYSDDEALLLPALLELSGGLGVDLPGEMLLLRPSILDNLLALVGSSRASRSVRSAAAGVLAQLLHSLKQSLALQQCPRLAHSQFGDTLAAEAAAEAAGAPRQPQQQRGTLAGFSAAAKALAAATAPMVDPSCPNSYPQLVLPADGVTDAGVGPAAAASAAAWRLLPLALGCDDAAAVVDVTAAVNSICLQVTELLKQPERHPELLPLLEEALPLLAAPLAHCCDEGRSDSAGMQDQHQQMQQQMQAVWRGLLAALSRALASCAAVAAADRAAAASTAGAGSSAPHAADQLAAAAAAAVPAAAAAAAALAAGAGSTDGGLCVWDLPTLNLLLLGLRWVNAAPASWCTAAIVPHSLADTIAAAACDEAVALLLPQLRQSARALLLPRLRPAAEQALCQAAAVPRAWAAGEAATEALSQLLQQPLMAAAGSVQEQQAEVLAFAAGGWLQQLRAALQGLGHGARADARLLQSGLQGLSLIAAAAAADAAGNGTHGSEAGQLLLSLLCHANSGVQQLVLQLLASAVASAETTLSSSSSMASSSSSMAAPASWLGPPAVLQLLQQQAVLHWLVIHGLSGQEQQRSKVSGLLSGLLRCGGPAAAAGVLPWRPWICCFAAQAGAAGSELLAAVDAAALTLSRPVQQGAAAPLAPSDHFWSSDAAGVVADLFSASTAVRSAAGQQLLALLTAAGSASASAPGLQGGLAEYADDPFKGLLDISSSASSASSAASRLLMPPDPLTDAAPSLAAAFSRQDTLNLLAVLANQGLAQELRRSAAEELLLLCAEPRLRGVMAQTPHLEAVWALCVAPLQQRPGSGGVLQPEEGFCDMQLPIAGLQLLAVLLARDSAALAWFVAEPDRLLQPLLPLALHALSSVRKAAARVLALGVFGHAAQLWDGFSRAAASADSGGAAPAPAAGGGNDSEAAAGCLLSGTGAAAKERGAPKQQRRQAPPLLPVGADGILLPQPFALAFKFPFKVQQVPCSSAAEAAAAAEGAAVADSDAPPTAASGTAAQAQHQTRIQQLVEQQQLLRAAAGASAAAAAGGGGGASSLPTATAVAAAARALLADCLPPELSHLSQRVIAATAANLIGVDPAAVAARGLAAVAEARSHGDCTAALQQLLQQLGGTAWGLHALGSPGSDWLPCLQRLLGTAPITSEDQQLWLLVLQLLERVLAAAPPGACSTATYSQLQLLLRASVGAWLQQPGAAAAVPRPPLALAAGTSGWSMLAGQPSSAAAAAAVAEVLGLSDSDARAAASSGSAGVLMVQVSRQALQTLLQLIQCVKRDCAAAVTFTRRQRSQGVDGAADSTAAAAQECYSLSGLAPSSLLVLLADAVVGLPEGDGDYGCRVLGAAVVSEMLGALQDVARVGAVTAAATAARNPATAAPAESSSGRQQQPLKVPALPPPSLAAAADADAAAAAQAATATAVLHLLEPLITRVLMPLAGRQLPGFKGKSLVRAALACLTRIAGAGSSLVPDDEWTGAWAAIGGTFWLSRLCRDREAAIRCLALDLTAALLSPGRGATQALVTSNWPDCVHRLLRVAGDVCEAHGVRAAALRGLAASMVLPLDALPQQQQQPGQAHEEAAAVTGAAAAAVPSAQRPAKMHFFGLAPLLQAEQVWQQLLPELLRGWQQQPPALTAAAAVLAAAAMAAAPDSVGRQLLLLPGVAAGVLQVAAAGSSALGDIGGGSSPAQQHLLHLEQLGLRSESDGSSGRFAPPAALSSWPAEDDATSSTAGASVSPAQPWVQQLVASVAAQQACDQLDAAAGALQLLAAASAPASASGSLLLLPASVQAVVQAAPAAAVQLLVSTGDSLAAQQQAATRSVGAAPAVGASAGLLMSLQQQQLTAVHVAASALAAQVAAWPVEQRRQQLLHLLLPRQEQALARADGQESADSSSSYSQGQRLLRAVATCFGHPACSEGLRQVLTQLLGLLLSDADVAAAALRGSSSSSKVEASCWDPAAAAVPVGALLCRDLAARLPASIFSPSSLQAEAPAAAAAAAKPSVDMLGSSAAWAAAGGTGAAAAATVAPPEGLVVVFALQNLLAFSQPAKAAAVECGLHKLLLTTATSMAAAVAAAAGGSGSAGTAAAAAGSGGAGGRVRAKWFSTPAEPTAAAGSPAVAKKVSGAGASVAFGRSTGSLDLPGFSAAAATAAPLKSAGQPVGSKPAGSSVGPLRSKAAAVSLRSSSSSSARVKRGASQGAASQESQQQQQQAVDSAEQQRQPPQSEPECGGSKGASDGADAPATGGTAQTCEGQLEPSQLQPPPAAADVAPAAGAAVGSSPATMSKQQLAAAARALNLQKLLLSVVLLRHLAYGCSDTQAALTADGLPDVLLQLWPLAVQHPSLLLELCRLLANALPSCFEARLAAASLAGPMTPPVCGASLLHCLLSLLLGQQQLQLHQTAVGGVAAAAAGAPTAAGSSGSSSSSSSAFAAAAATADVVRAAGGVLLGYASTEDGAAQLVKAGCSCLPEVARSVRACIVGARREAEQQRQLNGQRLACLMQLLAVLAGCDEGQRAMLRPTVAPVIVELAAEVLQLLPQHQPVPAAPAAALLLLRNLSFSAELRPALLANAAALPLLLAAAESVLLLLPAPERQRMQQRLGLADGELAGVYAGAEGSSCDCRPPKWAPLYGRPLLKAAADGPGALGTSSSGVAAAAIISRSGSPGRGAGSAAGSAAAAAAAAAAAGGSSCVPGGVGNVACAVYAASALWSLMHGGEKVKAALRKLPAAAARLQMVRQHAEQLLLEAGGVAPGGGSGNKAFAAADADGAADTAAVQDSDSARKGGGLADSSPPAPLSGSPVKQRRSQLGPGLGVAGGGKALQAAVAVGGGGGVFVEAASLCPVDDAGWWLQQLRDSTSMALNLLESV